MSPPHHHASGRVASALRPAGASRPVTLEELLLFGVACYAFGLVSGAVLIPWLVDRGLFPVRRRGR